MSETEHDVEDGGPQGPSVYSYGSLQAYDLIGVGLRTVGNILHATSSGFHMLATEFMQAATHRRQIEAELLARAEADYHLRRWAAMDDGPLTTEEQER